MQIFVNAAERSNSPVNSVALTGELISQNVHWCSASLLKFSEARVMSRCAQKANCSLLMFVSLVQTKTHFTTWCRSQSITK